MIVTPGVRSKLDYLRTIRRLKNSGWKMIDADASWRRIFVILNAGGEPKRIEFIAAAGEVWAKSFAIPMGDEAHPI